MKHNKSFLITITSLLLCASLIGCSGNKSYTTAMENTQPPAPVEEPAPVPVRPRNADAADKEETVNIKADATGIAYEITVETVLNYEGSGGVVSDWTNLSDIKNTKGDENFVLDRDGKLLWDDHGSAIEYKGTSTKDLPVTVHITYFLDGQEMTPEQIAGKSGHVTIRFDYENHTQMTQTVLLQEDDDSEPAKEEVTVCVPFMAITAVVLPEEHFSNIALTNGKLISMDDQNMAMGYALPGLAESLKLEELDLDEDPDIPSYFLIEADTESFELDFTATVITNGLFEDKEDAKDLEDLEKLPHAMEELSDATDKLVDAGDEFSSGVRTFSSYFSQYLSGISQLAEGIRAMDQGITELNTQKSQLEQGAKALADGIAQLSAALDSQDQPDTEEISAAIKEMNENLSAMQAALSQYSSYLQITAGSISTAKTELENALDQIDETDEQLKPIREHIETALEELETADSQTCLETAAALEQFSAQVETLSGFVSSLEGMINTGDLASLAETVNQLKAGADQLYSGVSALNQGIEQIHSASSAIENGMEKVNSSGSTLSSAVSALSSGADEFASALRKYNDEAIEELTSHFDNDMRNLLIRLKGLKKSDLSYTNYGGIEDGRTGSVRFIIETDSIEAD